MGELRDGLVHGQDIDARTLNAGFGDMEVEPPSFAASFAPALAPRLLDENAAHGFGGGREEVWAAMPGFARIVADEPQVRFVDEGRGIESLARWLPAQLLGRQLAQLVVNQRQ